MDDFMENVSEDEGKTESRRRKIILLCSVGTAVVIGITAVVIFAWYYMNRSFSGYDVVSETARTDSNNVTYQSFQDMLLKYSRDGVSLLDGMGKTLWNGGYEMEKPAVDTCGNYVAVADIGAKSFHVYNGEDQGVDLETVLPIGRIKVSANGKAAVLVHDVDSDIINIYDPYNTVEQLEVEIPTNVVDDGYPLDFDISPDGNSLVIAYMLVANGTMENKICFYNFTEIGQDQNTLVGGKSFDQNMISSIEFVAEDEAAVFYENGFSLFSNMKKPEAVFEKIFEEEIKSVCHDEENILIITGKAGSTKEQEAHLFNLRGKEEMTREISYEYSDILMADQEIIFTGEQTCHILRKNGREKFSFDFGKNYDYFFPAAKDNQYYYLDKASIQLVKLSG
ncbi:MAG: DUF5711 family protein [Roseburia sp.]|nr:DUF5711 family protein [Roseburia sp.]